MSFATSLLWAHVRRGSSQPATPAEILFFQSKPKVGNERLSRAIDQNIGGLDVPVDQATSMGVMQGFSDCRHQCRRLVKTGACFLDRGGKVASFDVLGHDEAETIVGTPHVVDRDDMGMIKAGKDTGFVEICLVILGLCDSLGAWHLDRNRAVEVFIVGEKHLPKAAFSKAPQKVVTPNFRGMEK